MKHFIHHYLYTLFLVLLSVTAVNFYAHGQTFNPTDDTDNQSDNSSRTNTTLNVSKWSW